MKGSRQCEGMTGSRQCEGMTGCRQCEGMTGCRQCEGMTGSRQCEGMTGSRQCEGMTGSRFFFSHFSYTFFGIQNNAVQTGEFDYSLFPPQLQLAESVIPVIGSDGGANKISTTKEKEELTNKQKRKQQRPAHLMRR